VVSRRLLAAAMAARSVRATASLEADWNTTLSAVATAQADLARAEQRRPTPLTDTERAAVLALGRNLPQVWTAPSTSDKDRKQLLRTLLDEVTISLIRDTSSGRADLVLRWKGGAITDLTIPLKRKPPKIRTDEDTVDLVRRLAQHYPDAVIAGILDKNSSISWLLSR
jgi:hypothetical protein